MSSSLEISTINLKRNSANGVSFKQGYYNATQRDIKYITFTYIPYNRVGDPVSCEISNDSKVNAKVTGPIKAMHEGSAEWDVLWYNPTITRVDLLEVFIEYMDGGEETIDGADLVDISSQESVYYKEVTQPWEIERAKQKKEAEERERQRAAERAAERAEKEKKEAAERAEKARREEFIQAYKVFGVFSCMKKVKDNEEMSFHVNQGLWLFIIEVLATIILLAVPEVGFLIGMAIWIVAIALSNKCTQAIHNNERFELPLLGKIQLVK